MDVITTGAIDGLAAVIRGLLPPPPVASLPHLVAVTPRRVAPTGLGGFVGIHQEPYGEILGRRLDAVVTVTVRVRDAAELEGVVTGVTTALVGADQAATRRSGLLRLGFDEVGPVVSTGSGAQQVHARAAEFVVLFEHLRLPEESEGTIEAIPQFVEVGSTGGAGEVLYRARFAEGSLAAFEIFDDPAATQNAPSQWELDAAESRIRQASDIRGGSNAVDPEKPGTYLVLRAEAQKREASDFVLSTELLSDGRDGIGLVFRWLDVENFYFLLLDERRGFRMLARKVAGTFGPLDEPALDTSGGHTPGATHSVRISGQGDRFRVHLDGTQILQGRDGALPEPGRVGFLTWSNGAASFDGIDLIAL